MHQQVEAKGRKPTISLLRKIWLGWKAFAVKLGNIQARVILTIFYFILLSPFGLGVRFLSDPLGIKRKLLASYWITRAAGESTLEKARRQF